MPPVIVAARGEAPKRLEVGQSSSIIVALIPASTELPGSNPSRPGNTVVVATAIPVGTPGASLARAQGPGYAARARATLDAIEFSKQPDTQEFKAVSDRRLEWQWSVSSKSQGTQLVLLGLDVEWVRTAESGEVIRETVWSAAMEIEITRPFISLGQLQVATFVTGFVSSGLTIPFLYGLLKEHRSRKPGPPDDSLT
jgi:hypothetical protein